MSKKYLDEAGLKIVWDKTKEKIAESCAEVDTKVDTVDTKAVVNAANIAANTEAIEEVNAKVDAIEDLTLEEVNAIINTVTFSISRDDGDYFTECQAEEGMTWAEFANSEYNNGVVYVNKSGGVYFNPKGSEVYLNGDTVYGSDVIEDNAEYLVYNV